MAKDREIELIEKSANTYEVNNYTIRYDSKSKRFFKGFAPKVVSGGLISTALFATLGVATLATGGIAGIGIGAIAGASVAVGTTIQTAYSGIVYGRNASRSRFKALGVGGKEDNVGTIGLIKEYEQRAHEYTKLLEDYPSQNRFPLEDGATYSRRDLKRRIKESEDIAYHGLKYILGQGRYVSEQINALNNKSNLTEAEEDRLSQYWDIMDRIGECVETVATKRVNFNPYKNLIIESIKDGCLLGNDEQNNQIRSVATTEEKGFAAKVYMNMYELPLLNKIKKERKATLEQQMLINEENKRVVRTREELIKHDRDIAKVSKENQTLAMEINELDSYSLLIDVANRLAVRLPKEFVTEKTLLVNTTTAFKNAIDVGDTTLIDSNKDALDQLVIDTENELYIWYNETGKKAGLEKFQKEFDEYKLISQQKLDNTTKKYQTAVRIAYDKRAQNKELKKENRALTQQLDSVQTDFEVAAQGWYENEQQLKQTQQQLDEQKSKTKKAGRKVARIIAKMIDEKKLTVSQNAELQAYNDELLEENNKVANKLVEAKTDNEKLAKTNKKLAKKNSKQQKMIKTQHSKIAELEDSVEIAQDVAYDTYTEQQQKIDRLEDEIDYAQGVAYTINTQKQSLAKKNKRNVRKLVEAKKNVREAQSTIQAQAREIDRLEDEIDYAQGVAYDINVEKEIVVKKNKKKAGELAEARKKVKQAQATIDAKSREIDDLSGTVNTYIQAQGKNIQRIIDLDIDNQNLVIENTKLKKDKEALNKQRKENEELAINLGYSLTQTRQELEALTSDRDAYKEMAEDAMATTASLVQEIEDIKEKEVEDATRKEISSYIQLLKMQSGKIRKNYINKIDQLEKRIVLTKENNVDRCLDDLLAFVDYARKVDLEDKELEDLQETYNTLKLIYDAHDSHLVKLPNKTTMKVTKVIDGIEVVLTTEQKTSVKIDR